MELMPTVQLLGNLGEFIGAILVVATLIYLAAQVRQNATLIGLNSYQIVIERYAGQIAAVLQDPDKLAVFREGLNSFDALARDDQAQFHSLLVTMISGYRHTQKLVEMGVVSEGDIAEQKRDMARIFKCRGVTEWRKSLNLEPDVLAGIDALMDDVRGDADAVPLNEGLRFLESPS